MHIANKVEQTKLQHGRVGKVGLLEELRTWDLWRAVLAEFVATMLFVFIGTMSAVSIATGDELSKVVRVSFVILFSRNDDDDDGDDEDDDK